jgi:hypothetical protein
MQTLSQLPPVRPDIRVVSTTEGAGVRVGASQILGTEGVDISSAGGLHVSGSGDRPTELRSERGVLKLTAADDLMLETVDGQAPRIEARAGKKLTLDAKTIEHIKHDSDSWNKKFWFVRAAACTAAAIWLSRRNRPTSAPPPCRNTVPNATTEATWCPAHSLVTAKVTTLRARSSRAAR